MKLKMTDTEYISICVHFICENHINDYHEKFLEFLELEEIYCLSTYQ